MPHFKVPSLNDGPINRPICFLWIYGNELLHFFFYVYSIMYHGKGDVMGSFSCVSRNIPLDEHDCLWGYWPRVYFVSGCKINELSFQHLLGGMCKKKKTSPNFTADGTDVSNNHVRKTQPWGKCKPRLDDVRFSMCIEHKQFIKIKSYSQGIRLMGDHLASCSQT